VISIAFKKRITTIKVIWTRQLTGGGAFYGVGVFWCWCWYLFLHFTIKKQSPESIGITHMVIEKVGGCLHFFQVSSFPT